MRNKNYILVICCLIAFHFSNSQNRIIIGDKRPNTIIKKTSQITLKKPTTESVKIERLAISITKGLHKEEQKSFAIFNWITNNIAYDHELMFDKKLQAKIYTTEANVVSQVLKRKKALCGGFAFLYRDLCKAVGLRAEAIHGYTKIPGLKRTSKQVHHTWNAVNINGTWHLIDITWAKSHGTNKSEDLFWYDTSPQNFIKTHLPEQQHWTLLNYKISLEEFDLVSQR